MPYTNTNTQREIENVNGDINVTESSTFNNLTTGVRAKVYKRNDDGSGWNSSAYGSSTYAIADTDEQVSTLAGSWSKGEHIGTGYTYFVYGSIDRGYHNGSGNTGTVAGSFSEAVVLGDGVGSHQYVIGNNQIAKLDNPNATVRFLQGAHCTTKLSDGEVTDNVMALILDLDHTGGSISGDFEYLRIQNDTFDSPVGGTARAINSLSTLPSEFGGSIQANSFIDTGVQEFADNAAAIAGGLAVGTHYRTGDILKIVH